MQFFKLCDFLNIRGRWHLGEITGPAGDEVDMDRGQRIEHTAPLQIEVTDLGEVLDFCLTSFNAPVCNAKLAAEIGAVAGDDVQVIPVEINEQKGMVALNAVRVVPCIDEARSEFIKWTEHDHRADLAGEFRQVTKLVLARDTIPDDAHFFRIAGWEVALIVSEEVKAAMERIGCIGATFIELES
jgi:hypothetical protein